MHTLLDAGGCLPSYWLIMLAFEVLLLPAFTFSAGYLVSLSGYPQIATVQEVLLQSTASLTPRESLSDCRAMAMEVPSPTGPSAGQTCILILILTVLLQSLSVAVSYWYFSNELKQVQDKYYRSGVACFLKEDDNFGNFDDEDSMDTCWQVKWQIRQLIRKMILRTFEETIPTGSEKQYEIPGRLSRVAAHLTGNSRRASTIFVPSSRNEKALGQKIKTWESSRKGHSFLNNLHLRNGELIIHQTGFYYIYSQTYFRFQEEETVGAVSVAEKGKKNKQMVQYIYKYTTYPDPILLMKSARNSCWSKDSEYGLYSIYQGGIFELQENDRIFVSVTNEQLIDMDQEASFFGAFLIG